MSDRIDDMIWNNFSEDTKISIRSHFGEVLTLVVLIVLSSFYIFSHLPVTKVVEVPKIRRSIVFKETPSEIILGKTTKQQVIFTFDGGSGSESARGVLSVLMKHGVKGTFFLTGKFVEQNPEIVRSIVSDSHEIFNHTYDHPHLIQLPDGRISQEFQMMADELGKMSSTTPKPYFRAPYGERDGRVLDAAARAGYRSIYWTIDAGDWEESTGMTADQVRQKILSNIRPGAIFLMHLGDTITGKILDDVFTSIEAQGYKIVSLTQGI